MEKEGHPLLGPKALLITPNPPLSKLKLHMLLCSVSVSRSYIHHFLIFKFTFSLKFHVISLTSRHVCNNDYMLLKNEAPTGVPFSSQNQSVAVLAAGDMVAFYHCAFYSTHNTLFDSKGRHYYDTCYIQGSIDFIFGRARSIFRVSALEFFVIFLILKLLNFDFF